MKLLSFIIQNIFLQFSFGYCPDGSIKTENGDCEEAGVFLQCSSNGFKVEVPQSTLLTEKSVVHEMQKPHLKMMVGSIVQDFDENDIGTITATFDEAEIFPQSDDSKQIIFEFEITISAKQEDVIIFTMRPRPVKARCIYTSLFEVRQSTLLGLTDTERVVESVHEWSEAMELSVFADSEYKNQLDGDKNQVAIGDKVYVSIEPSSPLPDTVSFYIRECIASESTVRRLQIPLIDQYECKSDILSVNFDEERDYMGAQNPYKFNFNAFTFSMESNEVFLFCRIQVCIDEEISSCLGSYQEKECEEDMSIHSGYEDFMEEMKQAGIKVLQTMAEVESETLLSIMESSDELTSILVKIADVIKDEDATTLFTYAKNLVDSLASDSFGDNHALEQFISRKIKILAFNEEVREATANTIYEISAYWKTLSYVYLKTREEGSTDWLENESSRDTVLEHVGLFTSNFYETNQAGEFIIELVDEMASIPIELADDSTILAGFISQIFDLEWDEIQVAKEKLDAYIPVLLDIGKSLMQARDELVNGEFSIDDLLSAFES